jgi:hypothetical protein
MSDGFADTDASRAVPDYSGRYIIALHTNDRERAPRGRGHPRPCIVHRRLVPRTVARLAPAPMVPSEVGTRISAAGDGSAT